jgi:Domain of unknown function (DUF3846)
MTRTVSSQRVAARPIRALIIQPGDSYEVREIAQDIATFEGLVGGYVEAVSTEHAVFWCDGKNEELPCNTMATYLWWKISPEMERKDVLQGPVFVTGLPDDASDSLPVPDEVIDLYERMERIRLESEA